MTEFMFYLLICFFSVFITVQIYLLFKIKKIVQKLIEILFLLDHLVKKVQPGEGTKDSLARTCKNCKNRVPYYLNDPHYNDYFYYRCQYSKRHVLPDYSCDHFMLDPQISDVK